MENFQNISEKELDSINGGVNIAYQIGYYFGKLIRFGSKNYGPMIPPAMRP